VVLPAYCTNGDDPCCECLYLTTSVLVEAAADGVMACIGEACKDFNRYVSINRPADIGDFVAGWVGASTPLPSQNGQLTFPKLITPITIRLMESGYPSTVVEAGSRLGLRSGPERDFAAWHFMGHVEAALRAMVNASKSVCGRGCERFEFVNHTPGQPEGTHVWWEFNWRMIGKL
jgi:hypothetical protein